MERPQKRKKKGKPFFLGCENEQEDWRDEHDSSSRIHLWCAPRAITLTVSSFWKEPKLR